MAACGACGTENADDARFCSSCGASLTPAEALREVRKTVTIVFSDVVGSTAVGERLDPESLRRVMSRYFDAMAVVVERHGGMVEKFIGDAIMAVFGIPVVHEDDALRAVRAAAEMREELTGLNEELERDYGVRIENRTGVNTGEVVSGDPSSGQRLVTGDAVNVAARLEQAAAPGEVLVGETAYRLVRDAVEAEPVEPLEAKGKTDPLGAHRLTRVIEGAAPFARRFESPLVGRERELALLSQAYDRAVDERSSHLFTLLGSAGIGKSRLVQEFLDGIDGARVVSGRCLSYGEAITYWPLVEILEQLGGDDVIHALRDAEDAQLIVNRVSEAAGQAKPSGSPEETPWAVRKLFEALAGEQPLVVVLDDLEWAEPTFLDLVEHIADLSRDAPILLLCVARPELLDQRPNWGGGKLNATSILLEPLTAGDADILIDNLLGSSPLAPNTRTRVTEVAEGNPLFVEQLLAMLSENGAGEEMAIPPTIQALLAARLDRLVAGERAAIERGSVVGKEFWRGAVEQLSADHESVIPALQGLVRKELVRPHRSTTFPREEAYRFRHNLVRDAAYRGMPKELRAGLHEQFAEWLEGERSGLDEIVGYHLEQAYQYRRELGPLDDHATELGRRAGERLGAAGERALARSDIHAAKSLLRRALEVLPSNHARRRELRLQAAEAVIPSDPRAVRSDLQELISDAAAAHDHRVEWRARVLLGNIDALSGDLSVEETQRLAEAATEALAEIGDEGGLARAGKLASDGYNLAGDIAGLEAAVRTALKHARAAGDLQLETEMSFWIGMSSHTGPTSVSEALVVCAELMESAEAPLLRAHATFWAGAVEMLAGRFSEGRAKMAAARSIYADLGLTTVSGGTTHIVAEMEILAGDPPAAEAIARAGAEELGRIGDKGYRSTVLLILAEALYQQGRFFEAEEAIRESDEITSPEDVLNISLSGTLRARLLAHHGDVEGAVRLAREIVAQIDPTDMRTRSETHMTLALVLELAGRAAEAREAALRALELHEQKGNFPAAERTRAFLAQLGPD
ncbi:MAG: AAA family ATPase [Actinomycetota bacterium]|nr:AAA family ATPase [Actinomycetota bacterium]